MGSSRTVHGKRSEVQLDRDFSLTLPRSRTSIILAKLDDRDRDAQRHFVWRTWWGILVVVSGFVSIQG